MAIEYIETAKSDKSHCKGCGRLIKKGEKRAVYIYGAGFKGLLCKKCAIKGLVNENKSNRRMLKQLR